MDIQREIFYKNKSYGCYQLIKRGDFYLWSFIGYSNRYKNLSELKCEDDRKVYADTDPLRYTKWETSSCWWIEFKESDLDGY